MGCFSITDILGNYVFLYVIPNMLRDDDTGRRRCFPRLDKNATSCTVEQHDDISWIFRQSL